MLIVHQPVEIIITRTRDKVISFVYHLSSAQKSQDLEISASEQAVSTTKLSEMAKNLLVFASNYIVWLTSTTNRAFFCWAIHVFSSHAHKLVRHW